MEDLEKKFHSELEIALFGADVIITSGGGGGGGCGCDGDIPCTDCGIDCGCFGDCGLDGHVPCPADGVCLVDICPAQGCDCSIDFNCPIEGSCTIN